MLDDFTLKAKRTIYRKIAKKPSPKIKNAINNFLEFFIIEPVSLDPYGIIKKFEHLTILSEKKFKYFVKHIAPHLDSESRANLAMGISGAITLNQLTKTIRHYMELIRKTRNLQLAMLFQMNIPLIERIAKALSKGTDALTNGWPIGDSVGALVGAHLIGKARTKEIEEETLVATRRIKGRTVLIVKAKGPGGRLGRIGRAVEKIVKKGKIAKIITIDAAAKLEGEKTGSVAEGVGVAIGGIGVDRAYIENLATERNIPLDSIIIKMSQEEAIMPMRAEILQAVKRVVQLVEENIATTKEKGKIIVVGVGNTCGVGNDSLSAQKAEEQIRKIIRIMRAKEKEEEKKPFWLSIWSGY